MRTRRRYSKAALLGAALSGLMMAPALASRRTPSETPTSARPRPHQLVPGCLAHRQSHHRSGDAYNTSRESPSSTRWASRSRSTPPLDWAGVTDHSEYVGGDEAGERSKLADQQLPARSPDHQGPIPRPRSSESSCMASGF